MLYKQSFYGGAERNQAICNFLNDVFGTEDGFIINNDMVYINGNSDFKGSASSEKHVEDELNGVIFDKAEGYSIGVISEVDIFDIELKILK